ncbi:hypothetical protein AVEN_171520-1 [Araneus ventricosus]|uniref:Glycosyltransferase family 92 protein n=1 Tax=Araneus ventricosus TaxID=182803 RepID=A0A4Y2LFB0_ARAVE|nr:hypothetical protein AVEN_171520-1 [Araneus ventricosus]
MKSDNDDLRVSYRGNARKSKRIPSIIVYSTKNRSEKCTEILPAWKISVQWNNKWQKLKQSPLFLYSAYKDNRLPNNNYIRILAMSKGKLTKRIFCRIWFHDNKTSVMEAEVDELWVAYWDYAKPHEYYRPLLVSCSINEHSKSIAVSVITEPCQEPTNVFWFNSTHSNTKQTKDFAICLKPLNFQNDISLRLLEWLELQILLGASNITTYMYHLNQRTFEILRIYEASGRISIINHTLPENSSENLSKSESSLDQAIWQKRRHEMLIYNDCFYKYIESHKFVINLDLDEAIIPLKHNSWIELLEYIKDKNPKVFHSASISVRNVYFFEKFGDESNSSLPKYFHMLRHLQRSTNFTPPGFAQKSFFPTRYAMSVSNHYALKSLYPGIRTSTLISKDLAQMHHYRASCPSKMEKECKENYMKFQKRDPAILRFKDKLVKNVIKQIKELNSTAFASGDALM